MTGLLPIAFTTPWILAALAALPLLWWLLRLTPPRPKTIDFPPLRLLLDIEKKEETPQSSPWWLILLRLLLAAAVIIALAGPIWRPNTVSLSNQDGPIWVLIDNGWTSARAWPDQVRAAEAILADASNTDRSVVLLGLADGPTQSVTPDAAATAGDRLRAMRPRSWTADRANLTTVLRKAAQEAPPSSVFWLSDGTQRQEQSRFQSDLSSLIGQGTTLHIYEGAATTFGLKALENSADALKATLIRHPTEPRTQATVRALDMRGLVLEEVTAEFGADALTAEASIALPSELRNDIARIEITDELSAGAVQLVDDAWRRHTVGLLAGQSSDLAQPLLSPLYYLEKALLPFADLRVSKVADLASAVPDLLNQAPSVLMLADVGRLPEIAVLDLMRWVEEGGTLVRFAGPRTAGGTDQLVPVRLRSGDRTLGGSLSWKQPQNISDFPKNSPFYGLPIPPEVTVSRQVLAEPTAQLAERTWAMLEDGTPLVTARPVGKGRLVLFHVTADTAWTNLPLSGSFVDMLRKIVSLANQPAKTDATAQTGSTLAGETRTVLPPLRLLDGQGKFTAPGPEVAPIVASEFASTLATRKSPPGLYGTNDGFQALNLLQPNDAIWPLDLTDVPGDIETVAYPTHEQQDLRAPLFLLALLLLLVDTIAVLFLFGGLQHRLRFGKATASLIAPLALSLLIVSPSPTEAQQTSADIKALESALETRLAYVITGDPTVDATSAAGLTGLSRFLGERTALEPGAPVGVEISDDELAFYSLLYWPVTTTAAAPDEKGLANIDTFMRNGGTILFDTRDNLTSSTTLGSATAESLKLREILAGLDIPPLEPVPTDHVLTKAFYILDVFPGRYSGGPLWVASNEPASSGSSRPVRAGDGVSPILITGNDFAAAWAIDSTGAFMMPTVPNDQVQREYSIRTGINIVMYTLTGNYKADQVHIPALLERLGQ